MSLIEGGLRAALLLLELAQQSRRGGDLDAAFEASVVAYLRGWGSG